MLVAKDQAMSDIFLKAITFASSDKLVDIQPYTSVQSFCYFYAFDINHQRARLQSRNETMSAISRVDSLLSITSPPPYSEASVILTPDTDLGDYGFGSNVVTVSACQRKNRCKKVPLHAMHYYAKHKCTVQKCGKPKNTRVFRLKRSIRVKHQCQCYTNP